MKMVNPVLGPLDSTSFNCPVRKKPVLWEEKDVFNPAAVVKDGFVYLLYRAEDKIGSLAGTSRVGIAWSDDGKNFQHRLTTPVLFPAIDKYNKYEWEGGCEDPRVVEMPTGDYLMTYTSYDGTARLSVATSQDLFTWTKHGPAFGKAFGGAYINAWTKSGSIVVEPQPDGRLVAVKINGTYWMYWGENDLHVATSNDLINWTPVMTDHPDAVYRGRPDHLDLPTNAKKPMSVLTPRKGKFDSELVEPGPPAILRPDGILFIYNSKNKACHQNFGHICSSEEADPNLAPGTYSAGQVLFARDNPTLVLKRTDSTFFKPTESFEITGQVGNVCFLEGLVFFKGRWLLYYGTADSKIAVAEASMYDYRGMLDYRAKARKEAAAAIEKEIERSSASSSSSSSSSSEEEDKEISHPHKLQEVFSRMRKKIADVAESTGAVPETSAEKEEEIEEVLEEEEIEGVEGMKSSEVDFQASNRLDDVTEDEL